MHGFRHREVRALRIHCKVPSALRIDARVEHGLVAKAGREGSVCLRRLKKRQGGGRFNARFGKGADEKLPLDCGLALRIEKAERTSAAGGLGGMSGTGFGGSPRARRRDRHMLGDA